MLVGSLRLLVGFAAVVFLCGCRLLVENDSFPVVFQSETTRFRSVPTEKRLGNDQQNRRLKNRLGVGISVGNDPFLSETTEKPVGFQKPTGTFLLG